MEIPAGPDVSGAGTVLFLKLSHREARYHSRFKLTSDFLEIELAREPLAPFLSQAAPTIARRRPCRVSKSPVLACAVRRCEPDGLEA